MNAGKAAHQLHQMKQLLLLILACLLCVCSAQAPDYQSTVQVGNCERAEFLNQMCPNLLKSSTFVPLGNRQLLLNAMRCDGAMCLQFPANGMNSNQGSCILVLSRVCTGNVTGCCPGFSAGQYKSSSMCLIHAVLRVDSCLCRYARYL